MLGNKTSLFSHLHLWGGEGTGITGSEELGELIPPNVMAVPQPGKPLSARHGPQKEDFAVCLIN